MTRPYFQCFDASTFLQMNERKPTWNCPVCDKKALYDDLMIDGYFQEILDSKETTGEEHIMLERDGSWKLAPKEEEEGAKKDQVQAVALNLPPNENPTSLDNSKVNPVAILFYIDLIGLSKEVRKVKRCKPNLRTG